MFFLNYNNLPLLSILIFTPLLGTFFLTQIPSKNHKNIRNCTLWINFFTLLISLLIAATFDKSLNGFQCVENLSWVSHCYLHYHLGLDKLSLIMIVLVASVFPITTILSCNDFKDNYRIRMATLLFIEASILGSFCSINIILFYIFTETAFFSFLFLLRISSQQHFNIFSFSLNLIISSAIILIIFFKISYNVGSFSFEIIQYKLMNTPLHPLIGFIFMVALFIRIDILPFNQLFYSIHTVPFNAMVFTFFVPILTCNLFFIFRFYKFIINQNDTSILYIILLIIIITSFIKLSLCIKKNNFFQSILSISRIICCFILIDISLTSSFPFASIFFLINYCLSLSCLFLIPFVSSNASNIQFLNRNSSQFYTIISSYLLFSLFCFPCSCGFWGHILILKKIIYKNLFMLSIFYIMSLLTFTRLGCYSYKNILNFYSNITETKINPLYFTHILFIFLLASLIISGLYPFTFITQNS